MGIMAEKVFKNFQLEYSAWNFLIQIQILILWGREN